MNRRAIHSLARLAALGLAAALAGTAAPQEASGPAAAPGPASKAAAPRPEPRIEDLGAGRYRIGGILIDKPARRFTVPGKVLRTTAPLEYFAAAPGGRKSYETLLELESGGNAFNLACILVGLDSARSTTTRFQFDRNTAEGQVVELNVSWQVDGERRAASATELLLTDAQRETLAPLDDVWVYTGSRSNAAGTQFAAEVMGMLIGFVHDPLTIIEHRTGLGIGAYGAVAGNPALLPPVGTAIQLEVVVTGRRSDQDAPPVPGRTESEGGTGAAPLGAAPAPEATEAGEK